VVELVAGALRGDLEGVDDRQFIKSEMAFEEGDKSLPNGAVTNEANGPGDVVVDLPIFLLLHEEVYQSK
jgi:hypothetical protein